MSPNGPLMDAEALRKKVNGTDSGSIPASLTCDSKLVIWATTRHGLVTGEINSRLSTATASEPLAPVSTAASIAGRSASIAAVEVAAVLTAAAPLAVLTHQASAVRSTEI